MWGATARHMRNGTTLWMSIIRWKFSSDILWIGASIV